MIDRLRSSTLARETSWSMINEGATVVTMTASFILLASQLGPDGYGAYIGLYAILAPFTAFTLSGVSLTVLEHTVREQEDPGEVVRSCSSVALMFGGALAVLVFVLGQLLIDSIGVATMALLVTAELVLNSSTFAMVSSIQARYGFIASVRVRLVGQIGRLAALVALWGAGHLTLANYALVAFVTYGAFSLWVGHVARGKGHRGRRFGGVKRRHVRSTWVYAIGIGAVNVQTDGDKVALNAFGHQRDAGLYGAAYRIAQMGLVPITALVTATHVSFLEVDESHNDQLGRAKRLAIMSVMYAAVFSALILVTVPLLPNVGFAGFGESANMLPWLVPIVILRGPGTFAMNGLLGLGRNPLRTKLLAANAGFSVVLYACLVPAYSWKGAVVGTLASEVTMFVMAWVALYRGQRSYDAALPQVRSSLPVNEGA